MIIKSVTFYIKREYIKDFIEATKENQKNSREEKGVVCFDFFQCKEDETKFLLYEGYETEQDIEKHLETEHFKKWIALVEQWFSNPRDRVTYVPVL